MVFSNNNFPLYLLLLVSNIIMKSMIFFIENFDLKINVYIFKIDVKLVLLFIIDSPNLLSLILVHNV